MKWLGSIGLVCCALAQPPVTSDSRVAPSFKPVDPIILPGRQPIYVPPRIDVFDVVTTNNRPVVVAIEVHSNVVHRLVWWQNGVCRTNDTIISSNIVSCTTNFVPIVAP